MNAIIPYKHIGYRGIERGQVDQGERDVYLALDITIDDRYNRSHLVGKLEQANYLMDLCTTVSVWRLQISAR
jgi:hypothetical protein